MATDNAPSGNGSTGTDVAERAPLDVTQVPPKIREMLARIKLNATYGTLSAQVNIMENIASATSEEEIFAAANAGTMSGQAVAGRPFLLLEYDWKPSAPGYVQQGAFPFYALCRVSFLDDGKEAVLDCGGYTFVSVVDSLDKNGHLAAHPDGYPMILESRRMNSGYDVLIPHPYKVPVPAS